MISKPPFFYKRQMVLPMAVFLLGALHGKFSQAQVAVPGANVLVDQVPAKKQSQLWRFNFNINYSTGLFLDPQTNRPQNTSYSLQGGLFYLGAPYFNIIAASTITYDAQTQSWDEGFLSIRLNRKNLFTINETWSGLWSLSFLLPTGATGYRNHMYFATGARLDVFTQGLEPWSFFLTYSLNRFFHEYSESEAGIPNPEWSHRLNGNMNYQLSDRWITSLNGGLRQQITYQNSVRENLYHSEEIIFLIDAQKSLSLGHSWGDTLFTLWNRNGDFNFNVWDEKNSIIYIGFGMTL